MVALECLPRLPAHKLRKALAGEELGKRVLLCLSNSSKEVRLAVSQLYCALVPGLQPNGCVPNEVT